MRLLMLFPSSARRWKSTQISENLGSASSLPGMKGLLDYETAASTQSGNGRLARFLKGYPIRQSSRILGLRSVAPLSLAIALKSPEMDRLSTIYRRRLQNL